MMYRKFVLTLITAFFYVSVTAQESKIPDFEYDDPRTYQIADIKIAGVKYLDPNILISISGLSVGDEILVPGDDITNAMDKLWEQKLFSDIKISATKVEKSTDGKAPGIYLEIWLQERPRLSKVVYQGLRNAEESDVKEAVNLIRGQQVTDNVLINTENIIKEHFRKKGFYKIDVDFVQKPDSIFANSVVLFINVEKKDKVRIEEIIIDGNTEFADRKIRRLMKETKQRCWYDFKVSKFIREKFKEDKKAVIAKYNENGFRDARILEDSLYWDNEKDGLMLYMKIYEGRKYYFGDIKWVGNTKYTGQQLSTALAIKKGDVYDEELLNNRLSIDQDAMGNLYLDNGYLFYNCTPVESTIKGDTIDLEMRIYEGKQASISKVTVVGNTKTKDPVILREIRTTPGELFSKSDIIRTVRELASLGHFDPEKIVPTPMPNPADATVDLEYALEERPNDQIEISGGWGAGMIVGSIGLRFNNFAASEMFKKEAWRPIPSGDGQQLSLRAQTNGKQYQLYSISFVEPWLGGKKPNSFSISLYRSIYQQLYENEDGILPYQKTTGISMGLGQRLKWPDDYFSVYNSIEYQKYSLKAWKHYAIPIETGKSNSISFTTVFSRNSLDNPLYTRRGSKFSVSLQITPPYSLLDNKDDYSGLSNDEKYKWIEFHKWKFNAEWFTPIVGDLVLHSKAEYGFLGYYNKDLQSPFEGFTVGGGLMGIQRYGTEPVSVRGYGDGSLTPDAGGNIYTKYSVELRYPLSLEQSATIYAMIFGEAGNAWNKFRDYNPFNVHRSAGVGVRIFLPMLGLMGIDWAYGFDPIPGVTNDENWGPQFHFVLGQQF